MITLPFIRRHRRSGWIGGVFSGLAAFTKIPALWLRAAYAFALFCFPLPSLLLYICLFFLMKPHERQDAAAIEDRPLKDVTPASESEFTAARDRYRQLSQRIEALEAEVLSEDAALRRRFRDAGLV